MAGTGLLDAMPASYFLAFALLLVGFVVAVSRPVVEPRLLGVYVVALILVLHGTTPLLYDEPRYPWVFTHLGVISFIGEAGVADRRVDIYNNWPGFFALASWLTRLTELPPSAYAEWAQVFFNLANVAALRFALRGVTGNERLLWTACWLFLLGNWVAQDYLAPQAFGFLLALVILGLALRVRATSNRGRGPRRPVVRRRIGELASADASTAGRSRAASASPLSPRGALLVGGLCYLAVVVSHQLTPLILIAGDDGAGADRSPRAALGSRGHGPRRARVGLRSPGRTSRSTTTCSIRTPGRARRRPDTSPAMGSRARARRLCRTSRLRSWGRWL